MHGVTWQTYVFFAVAAGAFGYSGYRFLILFRLMTSLKDQARPVRDIGKRIVTTIVNVLGQKAVLQKPAIGIAHALIFWGFIVITVGTLEQFVSTIYAGASFAFLGPFVYSTLLFLNEFFVAAVLLGVSYAAYRRFWVRPEGVGKSTDASLVLLFTASLMVSIVLMNSFHLLSEDPMILQYSGAFIVSGPVARALSGLGTSLETYGTLALVFKWVHMCLVLGFAMYIPRSKHLHIVAAGPNTFLKPLTREKGMRPINFEDEKITQYGDAKVSDMSWKDALDTYACTECGRCQDLCPAHNTRKPLSPKMLILDLKDNMYRNKAALLAGKTDEVTPLIDDNITEDVIWACTSCRACEIACPVFIEHTDKIYDIRRNLVMMEARFPPEVQTVFKNLETNASPWAFASADRAAWADGLEVKTMANVQSASNIDVLLWVGCAGSFDDRNKKVVRSFVNLLKRADVKFAILGTEEQCTGDPARRIGNEYLYQTLAKANVETLNKYAVTRIVTACPHCFNTLKNEYKDFGGTYEVFHHSQFIATLIAEGKLKPAKSPTKLLDETITFHDSCYLGRWNGIYDEPRKILASIPSTRTVEMKSHHDQSMCCGAGGGRMFMEEKIGDRVNVKRTEQALATRAGIIASSCPFCMTMMTDGVKSKDMLDKVKVMDIAELIDQATS